MTGKAKPPAPGSLEFTREFHRCLAQRPEISDEEFMQETEVPHENGEYIVGIGVSMTPVDQPLSPKELAEEGYMHDFDWNDSLFSS